MIPTQSIMIKINEVNGLLIRAKKILIEATNQSVDIREKMDIEEVQVHIKAGIKEILHTFYPKQEFDAKKWLKERTSKDAEHTEKMQKILDEAVKTGAFDAKEWVATYKIIKNKIVVIEENECHHRWKDCDSREVVGDDEHCLQGEDMR